MKEQKVREYKEVCPKNFRGAGTTVWILFLQEPQSFTSAETIKIKQGKTNFHMIHA